VQKKAVATLGGQSLPSLGLWHDCRRKAWPLDENVAAAAVNFDDDRADLKHRQSLRFEEQFVALRAANRLGLIWLKRRV
jgi:hypothetical protein